MGLVVEEGFLGDGSRRDEAHHVAADDGLGAPLSRFRGILELFADGDAVAEPDQALEVFIGAVDGHAAHRNVLAQVLAALR